MFVIDSFSMSVKSFYSQYVLYVLRLSQSLGTPMLTLATLRIRSLSRAKIRMQPDTTLATDGVTSWDSVHLWKFWRKRNLQQKYSPQREKGEGQRQPKSPPRQLRKMKTQAKSRKGRSAKKWAILSMVFDITMLLRLLMLLKFSIFECVGSFEWIKPKILSCVATCVVAILLQWTCKMSNVLLI